MLMRRAKNL